jgi:hypothetical protein
MLEIYVKETLTMTMDNVQKVCHFTFVIVLLLPCYMKDIQCTVDQM